MCRTEMSLAYLWYILQYVNFFTAYLPILKEFILWWFLKLKNERAHHSRQVEWSIYSNNRHLN